MIGETLGCSERTIEVHVSRLLEKAGVDSRTALVARFYLA
jgi:DNA-binding NarL/FixJ family response regulator